MIVGAGLPNKEFSFTTCQEAIFIAEFVDESAIYYTSTGFYPDTDIESCGLNAESFSSSAGLVGSWVFEHIAGSTGHIIDVNSQQSAQMVIDLIEQDDLLAVLEVQGLEDVTAYQRFVENVIEHEIKFYQSLDSANPIGEGCTGVYVIPLVAKTEVLTHDSVQVSISVGANGTFRRCELVPI
jgi:hypothetical protein